MPDKNVKTAQDFLDQLSRQHEEMSFNVDGTKANVDYSIDALLLEALELGDDDVDQDTVIEAFLLREAQLGSLETDAEAAKRTQAFHAKLHPLKRPEKHSWLRIAAAILIAVVGLSGLTVGAAYAFNWKAILQFFSLEAETFGISTSSEWKDPSLIITNEPDTRMIEEWNMVPEVLESFPMRMSWIPEGYGFRYYQEYRGQVTTALCAFSNGADELFLTLHIWGEDQDAMFVTEKNPNDGDILTLSGFVVTVVQNIDHYIAQWQDNNALYQISGKYTMQELEKMLIGLYGG